MPEALPLPRGLALSSGLMWMVGGLGLWWCGTCTVLTLRVLDGLPEWSSARFICACGSAFVLAAGIFYSMRIPLDTRPAHRFLASFCGLMMLTAAVLHIAGMYGEIRLFRQLDDYSGVAGLKVLQKGTDRNTLLVSVAAGILMGACLLPFFLAFSSNRSAVQYTSRFNIAGLGAALMLTAFLLSWVLMVQAAIAIELLVVSGNTVRPADLTLHVHIVFVLSHISAAALGLAGLLYAIKPWIHDRRRSLDYDDDVISTELASSI